MSLKTGILTLIGENGKETELKTVGKIFRIGSYLSCDLVLDNPESKNVHCEIQSDSFGRITITNHSKSNPVRINGVPLKGTRPLYTGSVISIFEKSLKWVNKHCLPRNIVDMDKNQTPKLGFKRTDQAPNSEPSAPMRRKYANKRLTMHNFGTSNHLADEDDIDTLRDRNDERKRQDRLTRASIISAAKSFGATPPRSACRSKILRRTVDAKSLDGDDVYKENKMTDTPEMKKLTLLKCQSSAMVVTSYSPNATPKNTTSSFARVMSNKNTPKSAYGTPRSVLSELNTSECTKSECLTPKTPTDLCTMYLIDLTSPDVYKTPLQKRTPLFRSALKNSTAKSVSKVASKYDPNSSIKSCTPSSNKKLRWNTSDVVIKAEKAQTPGQTTLNKSTPYRKSSITPNKLRQSLTCRSTGKKFHDFLSKSITETPPSLTRQRTLTAGSAKSTHSISKITPILKRKSLNISLPLKTPKETFSDGKSGTPTNSRFSSQRTPSSSNVMPKKDASAKKTQTRTSVSMLDRSKTFIVDSPSISQTNSNRNIPNKTEEHVEDNNDANDTFTCDEDFEMKAEERQSQILYEEQDQAKPVLPNEDVSILSNKSKHNLSTVSEDDAPVEEEFQAISEQENIEHEKVLDNPSNLSVSNSTFNKPNQSLNSTFDMAETETSQRKSLRRRSLKENETTECKTDAIQTLNSSTKFDSPQKNKLEEKNRKSTRLSRTSRNIEVIPCHDQIQFTSKTTTTTVASPLPMNENIVSNKQCLEKQLQLSLSEGQAPENYLDDNADNDESGAISEQENVSIEHELFNPSNMSASNSTFNKSYRSLNNAFDETEAEISRRKSLRRRTLDENEPEENKLNFSTKLNRTQEEKLGAKSRNSKRLSQSNTNIESISYQDKIQYTSETTKTFVASPISINENIVSNKQCLEKQLQLSLSDGQVPENYLDLQEATPVDDKSGAISEQEKVYIEHEVFNPSNMSASNSTFNKANRSLNNAVDETEVEISRRKSLRRRTLNENEPAESRNSGKLNFSAKLNRTQEEKLGAISRKSTRLSQTNTNIESISCQDQIQYTSETTTTFVGSPLPMNESILSNKQYLEKQLELSWSEGKAPENYLDLQEEPPVDDESGAIFKQENVFIEHEVFNPSIMSASNSTFNKSNRPLDNTFDETETSRRNSLRRRTLNENEPKESNISDKLNFSAKLDPTQEEKLRAKSRKSTRLSQTNTNIESISCRNQIQYTSETTTTPAASPCPMNGNNLNNKECLEKQLELSLSEVQAPENVLDLQEETPVEDEPGTISDQDNLSSEHRVFNNPSVSTTSFNKSNRSLNNILYEAELTTSQRKSLRRQSLKEVSVEDESGTIFEQDNSSIEHEVINPSNMFASNTAFNKSNRTLNNTFNEIEVETSRRKSLRRRTLKENEPESSHISGKLNFSAKLDSTQEEKSGAKSRKSKRFSQTNTNIESISCQDQIQSNINSSEISSPNNLSTAALTSPCPVSVKCMERQLNLSFNSSKSSQNDLNFMQETPVKGRPDGITEEEKKSCEFDEVFGKSSKLSISNSTFNISNRSLNSTSDNTERLGLHKNSQRKSFRRRSEKEIEPEEDTVHATEELNSVALHKNKPDEKRRKSLRLSGTNTNIESLSSEDQIDKRNSGILVQSETVESSSGSRYSVTGNDDNNKQSASPKLFGIKEMMKTPKISKDIDFTGVKELVRGRKSIVGLKNVIGVKELFNTPKQGGLTNLVGVKELIKTPKSGQGLIDAKGMKELFNTPTRDDLTDVFGVKELVNTPKSSTGLDDPKGMKELFNTPTRDDLTDVYGVKELVNTPKLSVGLNDPKGMKELFKTPTRDDLTDVFGVKELLNTPQTERGLEDPKGVKELFNTPARDDLTDVFGVKELVNTPKPEVGIEDGKGVKELFKTPKDNPGFVDTRGVKELFSTPIVEQGLDDGKGVRELFKTPRSTPGIRDARGIKELLNTPAQNNISDVRGVKELMKTPIETSPILSGMHELMKTPYVPSYDEAEGLNDVFKTPASRGVMVLSTPKSIAVEKLSTSTGNLLKTPKELNVLEDIDEVEEIFKTPVSNLMNSEFANDDSINVSPEESFDKLVGKPSIRRTYGRKSVTPRILSIPVATESFEDNAKTDIQEWVDNVVTSPNFEAESQTREEIIINSPVVKLHRKPLATSSSIKPMNCRKSSRFTNALLKDGDRNEVSGIEQLEESFISSSEISGVFVENYETSKDIIDNVTDSPGKRKRISNTKKGSITSKTPQKSVQFVDSSHHAIKITPQIRRLRNRVSTPYTKKGVPQESTNDPFADLSIQYIDDSSPKISVLKDKSNNTSLYKIRRSGRTNDVSLELIDSEESSIKRSATLKTVNNSTLGPKVESISITENSKNILCAMKKGQKSRKTVTESGCVISISDDEILSSTSCSKDGNSLLESASKKPESGPVEFVATNELSAASDNLIHSVDAFQSINNDSENITLIDVGASIDDTNEISLAYTVSENASGENSASLVDSTSYDAEEKLLNLYETRVSDTTKGQTLEIVYVDSNSRTENTNVSIDAGGINLDDESSSISIKSTRKSLGKSVTSLKEESCEKKAMEGNATPKSLNLSAVEFSERNYSTDAGSINLDDEPSSISVKSTRKSLRNSVMSVKEESCVDKSKEGNATQNSLNLSAVEFSERNNSVRKSNAFNETITSLGNLSVEQAPEDNTKNMSNEFANFDDNLEVRERFVGTSLTPKANKSGQAEKIKRKTMGGITDSKPIDLEAEKMRLEFSNFSTNPTVMMTRATSQLELRSPRLTVSRRTTGTLPLNPYFNVEAEKDRRNRSIEFENFSSNNVRRSIRGQSLSPVKRKRDIKERRTVGQKPLTSESFDYETELERRNMSIEFSQFEAVPSKRSNIRGRSLTSNIETTDSRKSKNRMTIGKVSENKFNYEAEVERKNMSLEFENFNSDAQVAHNFRRMTVGVEKALVSKPNSRLSEGQNVAETNFDLQAEQERRRLSLEFKRFDEIPSRNPRNRGHSENFESIGANSSTSNSRKTLGERPSREDFDMERELENFNIERELQNLNAESSHAIDPREHSQSPVKKSKLNSSLLYNEDPATEKNVEEATEQMTFNSQDIICNSVELPEGTNECLPENKCVTDISTKLNRSENKDIELEADVKVRHVRFGENVIYEISLLDSNDSNENENKNSRTRKKSKATAAKRTIENEKLAPRSRSRKNKTKEHDGSAEGMSEHAAEGDQFNAIEQGDKKKENVTIRRGKRNMTIVQQTEEKLNEVSSLKATEPSDYNDRKLDDTEVNRKPDKESSVTEEVVKSLKSSSNESSNNHRNEEDTDFEEKVNVETRRPRRGTKATAPTRKEIQSESLEQTSKVEEIVSKSIVQEKDIAASESDLKDENAENNTKTHSRRAKQTTSNKRAKQKEKLNIEDENTISIGLGDNTDANLAEHQKQESLRVETSEEKSVDAEVPKLRNRRAKTNKKVESESSVLDKAYSNEETLPSKVIVTAADNATSSTQATTVLNEVTQKSGLSEAETISKSQDNSVEHQEIEKNGKETMTEVRNDHMSSAKISRARKVAQINDGVRSSPRTKARSNAEKATSKKDEVKTVEIQRRNKTANDNAEIENSSAATHTKRSQRLVSIDVENEKITDGLTTDTSSSLLDVDPNEAITKSGSRGRNLRRKPLLESDTLNAESPADILPAKRTRRLASNVESTASDSKTKGKSTRAKVNKEDKENSEIGPENVANNAEVFKIPNELKPKAESSDEDTSVAHAPHPKSVKPKRARRLVSVDEQSTNDLKDTGTPILLPSTNIVPAKRTRRIASSSETTADNVKPKGRVGRAKGKMANKEDINNILEPVNNAAEVLQSANEEIRKNTDTRSIRDSDTLITNPEGKDGAVTEVPESEPVVTRRNTRLASVDDQSIEQKPANRTARTRGKKGEKEDSQSNESKEYECVDPKTESGDIVFKTPNEVKPKRRGARLRSTSDTPSKDSAEIESIVPARRTRRLVSEEPVAKNTPEITEKLSSDEQTPSIKRVEPENVLSISEQNNEKSVVVESQSNLKPKRGRRVAAKSQLPTSGIEQNKDGEPEEKMSRQPNEHPNVPEKTPEVSTSKTTKRGRPAKRKIESVEANIDEVVTRTRDASKSEPSRTEIKQNKDKEPEEKVTRQSNEQPNNPETTQEESTSKTTKRGRLAKRKVESVEVNTDEIVTRTRSRRK